MRTTSSSDTVAGHVVQAVPGQPSRPVDDAAHATSLGVSPDEGAVPLWVVACTLFAPPDVRYSADKVVTAVAVLMASTVRVHGDLAVRLSPQRLALLCGFERPEKSKWLTDYLQEIGFLGVLDGGVNPKTGRRQARRDAKGRPVDNEFVVVPVPPANYTGPRTLAEIDAYIAEDIAAAEYEHEGAAKPGKKKRSKPRAIPVQRRNLFDVSAGQPILPPRGMDLSAQPPSKGGGHVSAGQPILPPRGSYLIDRSSISEGEIEDRIEPVAGGTAMPPATGHNDGTGTAVRELVRRLDWAGWAKVHQVDFRLMRHDADVVHAAICSAMDKAGITLDQAEEIAQAALSEAHSKPVTYVADAFDKHLPKRLRALEVEPLADNPLPLLIAPARASGPKTRRTSTASVDAGVSATPKAELALPACDTCDAHEGEKYPAARTVTDADGRERPCPTCMTPAA